MVKASYDGKRNTIIVEFEGNVDGAQGNKFSSDLERIIPKGGSGFALLADFSSVGTMEPEVESELKKAMKLLNARGVNEIVRVLPDPNMDIGFQIMTRCFYSNKIKARIYRSRAEADASLVNRQDESSS
jgi:anti-anti-sigma regulatory factor